MQYRTFGRLGWRVAEIGYGMWGMGGWTGSRDDESIAGGAIAAVDSLPNEATSSARRAPPRLERRRLARAADLDR